MTDPATAADPVDAFREAWRRGPSPDLSAYLALAGPDARLELLRTDQYYRWQSGDRVPAAAYVGRLPPGAIEDALVLIWGEVGLRRAAGEAPTADEYGRLFPQWADDLARLFELEQAADGLFGSTAPEGTAPADQAPFRFAGYDVLGEVGRGATGVVYKARHVALGRVVALKVIPNDGGAARPLREATLAARLQHPNVVQVYEFTPDACRAVIAMEFVEGRTLAQAAGGQPQPPREAARQVETLAAAVHFAHQNGVIHRDLKPSNVLVSASGVLKVADFGLARPTDGTQSTAGSVVGTPAYMAPEQARGEAHTAGPAADVWALGAILYELLTGRPPFRAETPVATLHKVLYSEPTAPTRLQPGVPRDLETVCLKCLQKEPTKRYTSAAELAEDLRRFQAGESIRARAAGSAEKAWRWARRNPGWAAAVTAAAVLLAVVAAGGVGAALWSDTQRRRTDALRAELARRLWDSQVAEARATRSANRLNAVPTCLALLDEAARTVPPGDPDEVADRREELRDEYAATLALLDVRVASGWAGWPSGSVGMSFTADLGTYARADDAGTVTVHRAADGGELHRLPGPGPVITGPWLSPDGRYLAAHYLAPGAEPQRRLFWLWRLDDGPPRTVRRWRGWEVGGVAFAPDGRSLAVMRPAGGVVVVDAATGWHTHLFRCPATPTGPRAAFHPHRPRLVVAVESDWWLLDLAPAAVQPAPAAVAGVAAGATQPAVLSAAKTPTRKTYGPVTDVAWHPGGDTVAMVGGIRGLYLWDLGGVNPLVRTVAHPPQTGRPPGLATIGSWAAFDRTGALFASADGERTLRVWDQQAGRLMYEAPGDFARQLRFARGDGRLAAEVAGGELRLWELTPSRAFRTLAIQSARPHADEGSQGCIHPDGRLLVTTADNRLLFWDLVTGRLAGACDRQATAPVRFDRDGSLVTAGRGRVLRWAVRPDPADPPARRVGRPVEVYRQAGLSAVDPVSGAGVARGDGPVGFAVFPAAGPNRLPERAAMSIIVSVPARDVRISPDGRWIAAASDPGDRHPRPRVQVWAAADLKPVHAPPTDEPSSVRFSPDGEWLVTDGAGGQLWRVGTWAEGPRLGGRSPRFSDDGRMVAVESGRGAVTLHETATGRRVARLTAPNQTRMIPIGFTADGAKLVAWGVDSEATHVWDFRPIRALLKSRGLDWDWPEFGPDPVGPDPDPLRVVFE